MFNQQELKNLDVLIKRVQITGEEALAVASLQQKIKSLIEIPIEAPKDEEVDPQP